MNDITRVNFPKYSKKQIILVILAIFTLLILISTGFVLFFNILKNYQITQLNKGMQVSCDGIFMGKCPNGYRCYSPGFDLRGPQYCHKETTLEDKYKKVTPVKEKGKFCGGIAGITCPEGYRCQLDGNYPDAGGKCVIETYKDKSSWDRYSNTKHHYTIYFPVNWRTQNVGTRSETPSAFQTSDFIQLFPKKNSQEGKFEGIRIKAVLSPQLPEKSLLINNIEMRVLNSTGGDIYYAKIPGEEGYLEITGADWKVYKDWIATAIREIFSTFVLKDDFINKQLGDAATYEECLEIEGTWGKWGKLGREYCQIPSTDYMNDCTAGSQCQYGKCINGVDKGGIFTGKCQKFKNVFGCMVIVEKGQNMGTVCID